MVYIIAEVGVNHNGDLSLAKQLIIAAKQVGADAVKFQTFRTELLVTSDAPKAEYQKTDYEENQFEMLKKLELTKDDFKILKEYAEEIGITFFSTPFDLKSVDLLEEIGVPFYKLGSADLTNYLLIDKVLSTGKKLILSTGASSFEEVETTVKYIEKNYSNPDLVLLHCVSSYPTSEADLNLRSIQQLKTLNYPVGFSDHTIGELASCLAISLGAEYIEKHLTLDHKLPGPDHQASMDVGKITSFIQKLRLTEVILGDGEKRCCLSEQDVKNVARRSLAYANNLPVGHILTREDLIPLRPGTGICVTEFQEYLGKILTKSVEKYNLVKTLDFNF